MGFLKSFAAVFLCCAASLCCTGQDSSRSFTNPLLPSGADPYSFYKGGWYYYTNTVGDRIVIWKTASIAELPSAESKTVFLPPAGTMYSKDLWAPEILFLKGKWYIYFAADDGRNESHRMYVLENASADPMQGDWTFKGKVADDTDKWAIDGDVFTHRKKLYMIWSGWEGDSNGRQDIYIARMKNPWTIKGKRVRISSPVLDWERHGDLGKNDKPHYVAVNEGPQILKNKKKTFLIYSASGCWTDFYALGMLQFRGRKNLLDSAAWQKSATPVFQQAKDSSVYAPGHNSFFTSPDGTEHWILYHANAAPGQGCGRQRSPRAQKFGWKRDGSPDFGTPVKPGTRLAIPSTGK